MHTLNHRLFRNQKLCINLYINWFAISYTQIFAKDGILPEFENFEIEFACTFMETNNMSKTMFPFFM
jgi:hypothetical protein